MEAEESQVQLQIGGQLGLCEALPLKGLDLFGKDVLDIRLVAAESVG